MPLAACAVHPAAGHCPAVLGWPQGWGQEEPRIPHPLSRVRRRAGVGGASRPALPGPRLPRLCRCPPAFLSLQEIERLKSEKPTWERRLRWEGMKSVFGGPPSLLWMNPFVGFRLRRLQTRPRKGGPEFSV